MESRPSQDFHEALPERPRPSSSERAFGLLFALIGLVIGLAARLGTGGRIGFLGAAALLAAVALLWPRLLAPFHRLWIRLGMLLARVMNPIVLGVLFFLLLTPMALLVRLFGRDPLGLAWSRQAASYWQAREPAPRLAESMKVQF